MMANLLLSLKHRKSKDVQGTTRCDSVLTVEDSHSFPSQTSLPGKANFSKNCCICVLLGIKALITKIHQRWEDIPTSAVAICEFCFLQN